MDVVFTANLPEFVYLISKAKKIICVPSGPATLAVALNVPAVVYYGYGQGKEFLHKENNNIQLTKKNFFNIILKFYFKIKNKLRLTIKNKKSLFDLRNNF